MDPIFPGNGHNNGFCSFPTYCQLGWCKFATWAMADLFKTVFIVVGYHAWMQKMLNQIHAS